MKSEEGPAAKHYIAGELVDGRGKAFDVDNPATEERVGSVLAVVPEQAQQALEAAEGAFPAWARLSPNERGQWIQRLVDGIRNDKEVILNTMMAETGKSIKLFNEVDALCNTLLYFSEAAKQLEDVTRMDYDKKFRSLMIREPLGVVVGYLAWNYPLLNLGYKLGPILASGCTGVLKPSSKAPLASLLIGDVARKIDFPAGVFNLLASPEREVTSVLNKSSIPKLITMIASSEAGRAVIRESSTSIKRYSMELGGNAPCIVMPDVNVEDVAKVVCQWKFSNAGQNCVAPDRILVHQDVYEPFLEAAKAEARKIRLGWGQDEHASMGPLISKADQQRMGELVQEALEQGAHLELGGSVPEDKQEGFYFLPTILSQCNPRMRVVADENFGPIMAVQSFSSTEEAIEIANGTSYGLASFLFTNDLRASMEISAALEFGEVCINEPHYVFYLPHGGIKESGMGKDCSPYSLDEYYYIKRISTRV